MGNPEPSNKASVQIAAELEVPDKYHMRKKDHTAADEINSFVESMNIKDLLNAYDRQDQETFRKIAFYFMYREIKAKTDMPKERLETLEP